MVSSFSSKDKPEIDTGTEIVYNDEKMQEAKKMGIIEDRRELHRIPELERNLPKTMAYLRKSLSDLNCQLVSPMESSLCAYFDFGKDSTIAFRADCDGLPITEKSGVSFASCHPGKMHACGHDGHMAILLELARRLNQKEDLAHNVLLVFQPAEESPGGAEALCETGVLQEFRVRTIFGLHLWPGLEAGQVFSRTNELMSRSGELNVDIYGKSSHIAKAELGIDATWIGVEFYRRAMDLEAELPKNVFRLLKFGKFQSGTARNALSAHCHLEGSLRVFQDEIREYLHQGLLNICADLEAEFGCRTELYLASGYPALLNPEELCSRVKQLIPYQELDQPSMTSEDFSWYQQFVPGMFFFLGLGDTPALHADTFDFDETILLKGADFFEKLAESYQ